MRVQRYKENKTEELGPKESGYPWGVIDTRIGVANFFGQLIKGNGTNTYVLGIAVRKKDHREENRLLVTVQGSPDHLSYMLVKLHNDRRLQNDMKDMLRQGETDDDLARYLIYKVDDIIRTMPSDLTVVSQIAEQLSKSEPFFVSPGANQDDILKRKVLDFLKSRPVNVHLIGEVASKLGMAPIDDKGHYQMVLRKGSEVTGSSEAIINYDPAMRVDHLGGIDMNSANMNLQIKRDGRGVPLPLAQQDMAQLNAIQGFEPEILEIKPAVNLPILKEIASSA